MYAYMYVCMHANVCMHVCMYLSMYVCTVHVCIICNYVLPLRTYVWKQLTRHILITPEGSVSKLTIYEVCIRLRIQYLTIALTFFTLLGQCPYGCDCGHGRFDGSISSVLPEVWLPQPDQRLAEKSSSTHTVLEQRRNTLEVPTRNPLSQQWRTKVCSRQE